MRMTADNFRKLTGFIFILAPLWLLINSLVLDYPTGFPNIQNADMSDLLTRIQQSGTAGTFAWYLCCIPIILYMASTAMFHKVVGPEEIPWFGVGTSIGIASWAVRFLGLVCWIFVYPYLAGEWAAATDLNRKYTVEVVFNAFNNYAGYPLGQTVGIALTAVWVLLVGIAIKRSPLFRPWLGYVGIVVAFGLLIPPFYVSVVSWYISYVWMAGLGIVMMRAPVDVYDDLPSRSSPLEI